MHRMSESQRTWKDCKAWQDEGMALGTTSNEAAKYYDACLTQLLGWYDDPQVGGIVTSMENMHKSDPNFVLGRIFNMDLRLIGTLESIWTSQSLKEEYDEMMVILNTKRNSLSKLEYLHLKGTLAWAEGKLSTATKLWEEILLDFPTNIHALKMANVTYFYQGNLPALRDNPSRIIPIWETKKHSLTSYLYGMHAYGLEENNQYQKAELYAKKALEKNITDGWATHALAHIFEMEGRINEGLYFMNSTVQHWKKSNHIAGHNYWHVGLFHMENGSYDAAVEIFENEIIERASESKTMLDIADTSSLLYRLLILDPSSLKQYYWDKALDLCKSYSTSHISTFNDFHFMMAFAGCGNCELANELLETVSTGKLNGELADHPSITTPLLQAIVDFKEERYSKVVDNLYDMRYSISSIGGSNAQRDVFNLVLIVASLKSSNSQHKKLARVLINEREAYKQTTPLIAKLENSLQR